MTQEEIMKQINALLCEILKKNKLNINRNTTSREVEGWDSLMHMIIMSRIEKHFGIVFNVRELIRLKSVGDLCDTVHNKIN